MSCLLCQQIINDEEWQAFLSGQFHTAYGLLSVAGLVVVAGIVADQYRWLIYLLIFGISLAILVDLWIHGYTH